MGIDPELSETFEALKADLVAPEASAIASEAGRRQGQRRTMKLLAGAFTLLVGGLGVIAGTVNFNNDGPATTLELTNAPTATQPVLPLEENDQPAGDDDEGTSTTTAPTPTTTAETTTTSTTSTTTTTSTTALPTTTVAAGLPAHAPVAGATLSGDWVVVGLQQDGVDVPFTAGDLRLIIEGRSVWGSDGCNSFGGAGIIWEDSGALTRTSGNTTLVGCSGEVETASSVFFRAIGTDSRWGFTASGNLVFETDQVRMDLEQQGLPLPLGSFDGTHQLTREGENFSGIPSDIELPLLTIAGSNATLTSIDCELEFVFTPATANAETVLAFTGIDLSICPAGSVSQLAAETLDAADYGLALAFEGITGYRLWSGTEFAAIFVTPGFDPEAQ